MQILKNSEIELKFLMGLPVHIEGIGNFHSPLLTNVVDMTEELYNMSISTLFFDKKQLENQDGLDEYSNFEVLSSIIIGDVAFRTLFFYGLMLHLDTEPSIHQDGIIYFGEFCDDSILTEEKFDYIKKLVRIANNLSETKKEDEYDFGNDVAKKFYDKIRKKRELAAKVKKPKINLHSIISAIGWKSQSFEFISKLNIYQLYDGYRRLGFIDECNYTMNGIYTGNIDSSKIKLVDLNWANIIQ